MGVVRKHPEESRQQDFGRSSWNATAAFHDGRNSKAMLNAQELHATATHVRGAAQLPPLWSAGAEPRALRGQGGSCITGTPTTLACSGPPPRITSASPPRLPCARADTQRKRQWETIEAYVLFSPRRCVVCRFGLCVFLRQRGREQSTRHRKIHGCSTPRVHILRTASEACMCVCVCHCRMCRINRHARTRISVRFLYQTCWSLTTLSPPDVKSKP